MDIDLLGRIDNSIETTVEITRQICRQEVEPDGIAFDVASIKGERIAEDADNKGIRVRFRGSLDTAQIVMQLDIGFGDIVIPSPEFTNYPTLLDLPAPRLRGYSRESTVAEKFEAMVKLGILNSRMKDFSISGSCHVNLTLTVRCYQQPSRRLFPHEGQRSRLNRLP
jgi:hypothetical protein